MRSRSGSSSYITTNLVDLKEKSVTKRDSAELVVLIPYLDVRYYSGRDSAPYCHHDHEGFPSVKV